MQTQILKNAPKARCYKCKTTDITYICHHCGRLMCERHTFLTSGNKKNHEENGNSKPKLLTTEFTKLNLKESECGEEPYHCSDCIHIFRGLAWKKLFIVSISLIILLAIFNNRLGTKLLVCLTGVGLVGYEFYANTKRNKRALQKKPPLPVLPSFDKVYITEKLKGHITLDTDGNYQTKVFFSQGQLDIDMSLKGEDYERLKKYYHKYRSAEKFHAGFLVLKGTAGINFSEDTLRSLVVLSPNDTVIRLIYNVKEQPFLSGVDERNAHKKHISLSYNLLEKPHNTFFPIQLVLSFLLTKYQRGLEIAIQWKQEAEAPANYKGQLPKLQISKIELLELRFPRRWGRVENLNFTAHAYIVIEKQTIHWRKVQIETETEADKEKRCTFQVQFENRIEPLDSDSIIIGKVKVIFQKTLSGLEDIKLYFPTGKPHQSFDNKKSITKTEVEADFELSLANIRYQHTKHFPEDDKIALNKQRALDFPGISPTYNIIALLTDAMSSIEQGFYVKQVIENQPTYNPAVNILNRSWFICGRWYEGVYPIDFRVDLSGTEETEDQFQEASRNTRVRLIVNATYSNQEMEQQIETIWEKLAVLIKEIFQKLSEQEEDWETKALPPSSEQSSIPMTAFVEKKDENP